MFSEPVRISSDITRGVPKIATTGALVLAGSVMLSWVALFNHAPLVFADSLGYATAALRGEVTGLFSIFYSVLILPLHQGVTLWPVVFVKMRRPIRPWWSTAPWLFQMPRRIPIADSG